MNEPHLICLRCSSEEFVEDPNAVVIQLFRGMHLEIQTAVMVCTKCGWTALAGNQADELFRKTLAMYDNVTSGKLEGLKLTSVEEAGDKVTCDGCGRDWTTSDVTGGFIYDNNAYCPACCVQALVDGVGTWDPTQIQHCPPDRSFADWIRQVRYSTGQTQIRRYQNEP